MSHKIALSIACVLFSGTAFAATSGIAASNNQLIFQSISTNVDYTEIGNGQLGSQTGILDTETGPVPGIALSISAMKDVVLGNDYIKFSYDYSSGHTDYIGSLLKGGGKYGSVISTSGAIFTNYSVRYGKGLASGASSMLTPYLEFGQHMWERGINYGETYTNKFYGLGLLGQYALGGRVVLSLEAAYGRTSQSNIVVNSGIGLTGFSGPLGNSDLYKAGISIDFAFGQRMHGNIGVDYTAFNYGISALYPSGANSVSWEPDSQTKYTTFKFGLGQEF